MMSVTTIDAHYNGYERFAATYLLEEGDRAAFVETATVHAVPRMLAVLEERGFRPEQVDYVIITHVHLDHAGGASALLEACPNATLLAHPKAAPHVIEPSKLVQSAKNVYGAEQFRALYGEIRGLSSKRVRIVEDNEVLEWGTRRWHFLHTRGHANHHFCIQDTKLDAVFTGDSFGLVFPDLQRNGLFAIPSTSPTDFDASAAKASLERIRATKVSSLFPTHFGRVEDMDGIAAQLHVQLDRYAKIEESAFAQNLEGQALEAFCAKEVQALFDELLAQHGLAPSLKDGFLQGDIDLNAQGIAFAVQKRRYKAQTRST